MIDPKNIIKNLPENEAQEYADLQLADQLKNMQKLVTGDFLNFVKYMWPEFIEGKHHRDISQKFNDLSTGKINRLIVNMPPRHTKSEFASYFLPAWMIGKNPKMKLMQVSHNAELSGRFGAKVRNLIDSPEYKQIFGDVKLREDSKAKGR